MPEREIKIRAFTWRQKITGADGVERHVTRSASKGVVIDLPKAAVERGDALDAFVTDKDREPTTTESGLAVSEMGEDELINWVSESTIPQILEAANDDPEIANQLLQAENAGTGNDPRTGLVEGLTRIVGAS